MYSQKPYINCVLLKDQSSLVNTQRTKKKSIQWETEENMNTYRPSTFYINIK